MNTFTTQFVILVALSLLLFTSTLASAARPEDCRYPKINLQGSSNTDVTVSSTAIVVMADDAFRCEAEISNTGTTNMRCAASGLTPTSTVGKLIQAGQSLLLNYESTKEWSCVRVTTDTTANVGEVTTQ